ncbi:histidine kinase, partial [Roseburia intestinalis]
MLISYIQSIMMIILEVICCKIFFESFAEKRSKNNYRNYSIILGIVVCEYVIASLFYDKFILKQILAIVAVAVFMCFYFKIHFGKAIILSLLFQALLLSVDYFTLWLNVSLFDSIAEISRLHFVGGSLITVLGKIILFLVVLLIRKKVGGESSDVLRSTDWLRFIFFPVFTIFTVIALIMTSGNIENQKQENVFLVIALCLAGMNIVVFYMINDILKREIKIRENEVFQLKARNQTDMYRSISENFVKQRKKTHEYKNQIMCIESLIEMENYDELKDYVKSISGNLSTELDYIKTNNVIIDAILNSKYKET